MSVDIFFIDNENDNYYSMWHVSKQVLNRKEEKFHFLTNFWVSKPFGSLLMKNIKDKLQKSQFMQNTYKIIIKIMGASMTLQG